MSFRDYVAKRCVTETPAGDFLNDAKRDSALLDAQTWAQLETHLRQRRAAPEAIKAARAVWRGYATTQRQAEKAHA